MQEPKKYSLAEKIIGGVLTFATFFSVAVVMESARTKMIEVINEEKRKEDIQDE